MPQRKNPVKPTPEQLKNGQANVLDKYAPPPPPGNQRGLKHYGRALGPIPGMDEARAEILEQLATAAPVRAADGGLPVADAALVETAARELARIRAVDDWLARHGIIDKRGRVRPAAQYLEKATRTLMKVLESLGMSPVARARLGLDLARTVDLATAMSEPDPVRRAQLLREAGVDD